MDPHQIAAGHPTISDKIRALNSAGFPRAEIARVVQRRYQHVRNVLEADRQKESASSEAPATRAEVGSASLVRMEVLRDGSVVVPADILRHLGVPPGGVVLGHVDGEQVRLLSGRASLRRARELVANLVTQGSSMADELVRERREEARRG
ncbi:hypothetical protein [Brevundimonas aurifodinae]|uniref:AbrB/MazE/SpoVT family DNA-binding domain-containing protein n=2 Tax=Brevundimonas TaxID=41275 RepID=A0ABV1NSP7_9CAUL|nr:MAG: hypothetical protein B7Z42_10430 [Brevundimonas sp. 12-68-7]OYX32233.1 MAG: hypothetical protein B7Z01_11495 [Brevundimonas subvibrioides]